MATRDYNWLLSEVAAWLHRTDLTARIPEFIRMAEGTINRRLNIFPKEIEWPLATEIGSRFILLPSDFGSPLTLQERQIERYDLMPTDASQLPVDDDVSGKPRCWAIDGNCIAFERPADQAYPLIFRYVQNLYLSEESPSNLMLDKYPDMYLYGALKHSAPFIRDDARVGLWASEFNRIIAEVAAEASRSKDLAPLRTELPCQFIGRR